MGKTAEKLAPVKSLGELQRLAQTDERYHKLLHCAAENLGGSLGASDDEAYRWLITNAQETDEEGVVGEVNFCIDLV